MRLGLKLVALLVLLITALLLLLFIVTSPAIASEKGCLVEAVYHEARGEPLLGQVAVANVILNRVSSNQFPSTICKVVHAGKRWKGRVIRNKCAFSYYCDGKLEWHIMDTQALEKSIKASELALSGMFVKTVVKATYYHAVYVTPFWSKNFQLVSQIGLHKFYVKQ